MRWLVIFLVLLAGACAPKTDELLVDRVVSRIAPFSSCVRVGQTRIFKDSDGSGPPALLTSTAFASPEVRRAAASVAISWRSVGAEQINLVGNGETADCRTVVDKPIYSANFAFVSYSERGGRIGAFAFRRDAGEWRIAEEAKLGFW